MTLNVVGLVSNFHVIVISYPCFFLGVIKKSISYLYMLNSILR